MRNMDAASKLFIAHPKVSRDAVNFVLRGSGYKVVARSMQERNIEAIARLHGAKRLYKKNSSDVVWELDARKGKNKTHLLVAMENQSVTSSVMPLRSQLTTAIRNAAWRQTMMDIHKERNELKTPQELLDGILPGDHLPPVLPLTIHFGQEEWTGPVRLQKMQEIPGELRGFFADCPCNLLSLKNLTPDELSRLPIGPFRAVAKCIKYADNRPVLRREIQEDPSFEKLPDVAYEVVRIATGIKLKKPTKKEGNNMKKDVSEYDKYVLELGKEEGIKIGEERGVKIGEENGKNIGVAQTVQKYIWNRWKEHVTKVQILKDLESYFDLDEKEARRYMDEAFAKA